MKECARTARVLSALGFLIVGAVLGVGTPAARAGQCGLTECGGPRPSVGTGTGSLTASYFDVRGGAGYASNAVTAAAVHQWRLMAQCDLTDASVGGCAGDQLGCPEPTGRVVSYYIVQSRRLTPVDHSAVDGVVPPPEFGPGTPFGTWTQTFAGCVDVTDLNPAPTPDEIYRYFQALPLPQLATQHEPPGNGLVGLPVIFYTDAPTTQGFTVDIRGFTVTIAATATGFAWHTGDGTTVTSTDPGAPYPHQTVTHDYRSGTWTASLTTTWGATYTVNGGPRLTVPGGTTTDGPPVTFTVVQAHTVLTNPYD
jgi:hypothetical protein